MVIAIISMVIAIISMGIAIISMGIAIISMVKKHEMRKIVKHFRAFCSFQFLY
jgi:hypothetical protein